MADSLTAAVNDGHPLSLELTSLRAAVSRYQHEAHAASLKLQRHSFEVSNVFHHSRTLELENARLKKEVTVLRANPDTVPNQTSSQIPELTLALRRLSDKLTAVEDTLLQRTKEATDARSELAGAHYEVEAARALAAEARAREEEGLARERVLERMLKVAEEEKRMADLVVQEYADLVRKLEGRPKVLSAASSISIDLQRSTNSSTTTLVDNLSEGKLGLQRLLEEFNGRNERLQADIAKLHGDNGLLYKELEVARHGAEHDRGELAKALHKLDIYRADDSTATKMVSRYMKFSQTSTDTLQRAMDTLRLRHATTLATLNAEIERLQRAVSHERGESDRLRSVLDELTEDIARESYGRRREVSLRLAFLGREENLAESLRRWVRKAKEHIQRSSEDSGEDLMLSDPKTLALRQVFDGAISDAEGLLDLLNGQPSVQNGEVSAGSIARLLLAQDAVASLTHELQAETVRRLTIERKLVRSEPSDHAERTHERNEAQSLEHPVPHRTSDVQAEEQMQMLVDTTSPGDTLSPDQPGAAKVTPVVVEVATAPAVRKSPHTVHVESIPIVDSSDQPPSVLIDAENSAPPPQVLSSPSTPGRLAESFPSEYAVDAMERTSTTNEVVNVTATSASPVSSPNTRPLPTTIEPSASASPVEEPFAISFPDSVAESSSPSLSATSRFPQLLPLEKFNGLALSSLSPTSANDTPTPTPSEREGVPLLAGLVKVKHRYEAVQRGFRDCHLALKELRESLALPSSPTPTPSDMPSLLRKVVERLSDFNEDARVELEIRIADEERIASGYEALLSIPGAMASSNDTDSAKVDTSEMIQEVRAFVEGSDGTVAKATQQFSQKLDDLEHDIASIKRALHELSSLSPEDELSQTSARTGAGASPGWSSWRPSFLSPPRSTSPAPPTFGSVMTSPRLRHSSSFSHPRERSNDDLPADRDPLAFLGLRIVVPTHSPTYAAGAQSNLCHGDDLPRAGPRQRTTSGMFMLGLGGTRSASFGAGMGRQGLQKAPSRISFASSSTPRLTSTLDPSSPQKQDLMNTDTDEVVVLDDDLDVE